MTKALAKRDTQRERRIEKSMGDRENGRDGECENGIEWKGGEWERGRMRRKGEWERGRIGREEEWERGRMGERKNRKKGERKNERESGVEEEWERGGRETDEAVRTDEERDFLHVDEKLINQEQLNSLIRLR